MLESIRKWNLGIKIVLGLVILSFILFYAGSFSGQRLTDPSKYIARVGKDGIGFPEFLNTVKMMEDQQKQMYGDQGREISQQMRDFYRQQAVQGLVDRQLMLQEAHRAGIRATKREIQDQILKYSFLQNNGQFVGMDEYQRIVDLVFHMDVETFEQSVGEDIVVNKFTDMLTGGILVTDNDVEDQFRKTNLTAKIDYVSFDAATGDPQIEATIENLKAYYNSHKDEFQTGELRKVQYLLISHDSEKNKVQIPESRLREFYEANIKRYQRPEQVHARHILLKTDGKDDAAVEKRAEELVAKLRAGADFAEMAKQYSEDPGSKDNGGDLGSFGKGRMVPEFEQAAFSLAVNQISDPIKTQYGYHIIQVLEKQPAYTMDFALVKDQIYREIAGPESVKNAEDQAKRIYTDLTENKKTMAEVSKIQLVEMKTTDFFAHDQNVPGLSPAFRDKVFALKKDEISQPVKVFQDYAIVQLLDTRPSSVPPFENVQPQVTAKYRQARAEEIARLKAEQFYSSIPAGGDLKAAAEKDKLTVKSSQDFTQEGTIGELGNAPDVAKAAFAMQPGQISKPIKAQSDYVVFQLKERKTFDPAEFNKQKEDIRQSLVNQEKSEFLQEFRSMLRKKYEKEIWINEEALKPREA